MLINPYQNLTVVRNSEMFFGYTSALRDIYSAISHHQSLSLMGSRHSGKSSVLTHVALPETQQHFSFDSKHYLFVLINFSEHLECSSEEFFDFVSGQIAFESKKRGIMLPVGKGGSGFRTLLDQVVEQGLYPVLLMDVFDNIARNKRFAHEFFSFLRAQADYGRVSYITASIAPLNEICHSGITDSPFFNLFSGCKIGSLAYEEARDLVIVPAQRVGSPFTEFEVEWILTLAGQHPFFIQRVCYYLFEEKRSRQSDEIDLNKVESLTYNALVASFEHMWSHFSHEQQELLKHAVRHSAQLSEELSELSGSALFRSFVYTKPHEQHHTLAYDELRKALDKINDLQVLGESELKHLNLVAKRLKHINAPSMLERGKVIREVLSEALKRLEGRGLRSDTEDWKLYNILYYRYFKHHYKHELISRKLGFDSIRTYYRERNKAIENLLNALLYMESSSPDEEDKGREA